LGSLTSFRFLGNSGTDRQISISFGHSSQSTDSSFPLVNSKNWLLETIMSDPDTGISAASALTFDSDRTDSFDLADTYLLDLYDVDRFDLIIDNEFSRLQLAFATYDNWLVTSVASFWFPNVSLTTCWFTGAFK
jgi:hypothetical protein